MTTVSYYKTESLSKISSSIGVTISYFVFRFIHKHGISPYLNGGRLKTVQHIQDGVPLFSSKRCRSRIHMAFFLLNINTLSEARHIHGKREAIFSSNERNNHVNISGRLQKVFAHLKSFLV